MHLFRLLIVLYGRKLSKTRLIIAMFKSVHYWWACASVQVTYCVTWPLALQTRLLIVMFRSIHYWWALASEQASYCYWS